MSRDQESSDASDASNMAIIHTNAKMMLHTDIAPVELSSSKKKSNCNSIKTKDPKLLSSTRTSNAGLLKTGQAANLNNPTNNHNQHPNNSNRWKKNNPTKNHKNYNNKSHHHRPHPHSPPQVHLLGVHQYHLHSRKTVGQGK